MNSDEIFSYSEGFLNEIIEDLTQLKILKNSNPKNIEFDTKLRTILGKSLDAEKFKEMILLKDNDLKIKIIDIFKNSRDARIKILGDQQSKEIEKRILLQAIDINWKSHIQYLEQLRQVIGLRSYGQRDPLIEYKKEAFDLFSNLLDKLKLDYITILMNLKVIESSKKDEAIEDKKIDNKFSGKKMRRNEPCYCGSGKKYKHCCGSL